MHSPNLPASQIDIAGAFFKVSQEENIKAGLKV